MKNLSKALPFFVILFILLLGCEKENISSLDKADTKTAKSSFRNTSSNPFDYVGVDHNQLLDDYYTLQYADVDQQVIIPFLTNEVGFQEFPQDFPAVEIILDKSLSARVFLSDQEFIPSDVKAYSLDMLNAIDNKSIVDLELLEETVLGDASLNQGEEDALLIGIAVARHSLNYWTQNADDWVSGGGIQAANYAAIDAATAYFTAAACNIGYLSPPTGVTVTAFALTTGVTASVAAAAADGLTYVYDTVMQNW